LARVL